MTPEQRAALLDKVRDLVGEHVNSFVFIANVDLSIAEGGMKGGMEEEDCIMDCYGGGKANAIGLMESVKAAYLHQFLNPPQESE